MLIVVSIIILFMHCVVHHYSIYALCCPSLFYLCIVVSIMILFMHCGIHHDLIYALWCLSLFYLCIVVSYHYFIYALWSLSLFYLCIMVFIIFLFMLPIVLTRKKILINQTICHS